MRKLLESIVQVVPTVALSLGATSCALSSASEEASNAPYEADVLDEALTEPDVPSITTSGKAGCPELASWTIRGPRYSVDHDGNVTLKPVPFAGIFRTPFVANLDGQNTEARTECAVVYGLSSKTGVQYRFTDVSHAGHLTLASGVKARHVSIWRLGSLPEKNKEAAVETGNIDSDYVFDQVGTDEWTPCGLKEQLKVTTRLILKTSVAGVTSSFEEHKFDGHIDARYCTITP